MTEKVTASVHSMFTSCSSCKGFFTRLVLLTLLLSFLALGVVVQAEGHAAAGGTVASISILAIEDDPLPLEVGDTFVAWVTVDGALNLQGVDLRLKFNPAAWQVTSVIPGVIDEVTLDRGTFCNQEGTVRYIAANKSPADYPIGTALLKVNLTVIATEEAYLQFQEGSPELTVTNGIFIDLAGVPVTVLEPALTPSAEEVPVQEDTLAEITSEEELVDTEHRLDITAVFKKEETVAPDGKTVVTIRITTEMIVEVLQIVEDKQEVFLEIKEAADEQVVKIAAQGFAALAERGLSLVIKTDKAVLIIPTGSVDMEGLYRQLNLPESNIDIVIRIKKVATDIAEQLQKEAVATNPALTLVTEILEFTLEATGEDRTVQVALSGTEKIRGEFLFTPKETVGVEDVRRLNVYEYEAENEDWIYRRSQVDVSAGKVIFFTDTFSKFAIMENSKTFADIKTHWARKEIELMSGKYVIKGMAPRFFRPKDNITRAELSTLLVRVLDLRLPASAQPVFDDVPHGSWYYSYVAAAAATGLIKGDGTGFRPLDPVTRQEMAVMLVRALNLAGQEISLTSSDKTSLLADFADVDRIHSWAAGEMATAVKFGLFQGTPGRELKPLNNSQRGSAAAVIYRMSALAEIFAITRPQG